MATLSAYTNCCSAKIACGFGQSFDDRAVQTIKQIKDNLTQQIEQIQKQQHFTVVTAIIIRKQKNAKKALEQLGFIQASGWMTKPVVYSEELAATRLESIKADAEQQAAHYLNSAKKYRATGNEYYALSHEKYAAGFGEKWIERQFNAWEVSAKILQETNDERATMLFYLPLVGVEPNECA